MNNTHGNEGCHLAIKLIEAQLHALAISVALASHAARSNRLELPVATSFSRLKNKRRPHDTGSGGNIVSNDTQANIDSASDMRNEMEDQMSLPENDYLRIVISNALLVVRLFLIEHDMANMRTPEIQFLGHVCDAILNENTFDIAPGYIPMAMFDGLTIAAELNGKPLFGNGGSDGFMEFGDATALLQWLSRFLSKEKHFVTGGDAG